MERFNMARYCLGDNVTGARPADGVTARPDATALVVVADADAPASEAEQWTFAQLDDAVRAVGAGLLALGLQPGERVMVRMGNTSTYPLVHFGAIAAGLVSLPSSAQLTADEARFLLKDSGARAVAIEPSLALELPDGVLQVTPQDVAAWMASDARIDYADTGADDPAYLVYTSGTTGRPKGVLHAHRSTWGRRPMRDGWHGLGAGDRLLHAGAFNWTYTLGVGLTDPWAWGACAIVHNGPTDPTVWARLVGAHRPTVFAAVPGIYRQWLREAPPQAPDAHDLGSLRSCLTAGEALGAVLLLQWQEATGIPLYEALGMSECSTFISSSALVPARPGSPGKVQAGRPVAVLPVEAHGAEAVTALPPGQVGLLAVHHDDPGLMLGYWQRPEEQAEVTRGDWFVGGDLVELDHDGYVHFHGRNDDIMNAQGYRVSPVEVEDCLAGCPGVAEVGCAEVEARPGVRIIAAFVVPAAGADRDALPPAVLSHAAEHLAAYKRPRAIALVDALPRTRNGKVIRAALPARFTPARSTPAR